MYNLVDEPPVDKGKEAARSFRDIYLSNTVTKDVIEQLGGIKDTVRPIEESLRHHELRPYQISQAYRAAMAEVDIGSPAQEFSHKSSRIAGENAHIVSASPFRATI